MINYLKNLLLIMIGVFVVTWLMWARFIRERLPKDIPFELTEFRFYLLLYICFIFIIIIISLMRNPNKSSIFANQIKIITDFIYTPLTLLDTKIKINSLTLPVIPAFLDFLFKKLNPFKTKLIYDSMGILSTFYIIFNILPRLLLASLLLLDIFYFKKIDLFYNFILIGVIPFMHRYGVYSLKNIHRLYEIILEQHWSSIFLLGDEAYLDTDKITLTNENEDKEEAIEVLLKENFEFHEQEVTPKKYLEMMRDGTSQFYFKFPRANEQILKYIQKINYPHLSLNEMIKEKNYDEVYKKNINKSLHFYDHIINYSIFCYISKTYSEIQNLWYIKFLRTLAFSLYLFAWFYILCVSIHTLQEIPITLQILNKFSYHLKNNMNVFEGIL